jgi:murein L,D-transpeptidase YcbB/YkuD
MRKWLDTTIAAAIVTTALFSSVQSFAASKQDYQNEFVEILEIGPASELKINVHGKSAADIDKSLSDIYHSNGLQPFWIENGKPSQRAKDIISVLEDAGSHGLVPDDYYVDWINEYKDGKDVADLVRLDVLLSMGMMHYVADQREGRIKPREIDPVLFESASDEEVDWVALREAAFGAKDMKNFLEQQAPPFPQYRKLQEKMAEYRALAASGGWPSIADGETLKPGMDDPRIKAVRNRLAKTGDLASGNIDSSSFDAGLEEAVKHFQKRHNLQADGVIGKQTLAAMNVTVEARINQINVNMERYRWLKRDITGRLVAVNIASFEAFAGVPGKFDIQMPVVVGKLRHKTPVFSDTIKYIVFNPYWTLTPNIARNETLPKLKKDPLYLQKNDMKIFQGWESDSKELDATKIDWSKVTKKEMNQYKIRQEPGPKNALGTLKLVFPNKYDVYLHDTPSHGLFKREKRAFSHGCIRMDRPAEMAAWVLGGEEKGWSIERINEIVNSRQRKVVVLEKPLPIQILYRTTYVDSENKTIHFFEDIYGRDKILANACCPNAAAQP